MTVGNDDSAFSAVERIFAVVNGPINILGGFLTGPGGVPFGSTGLIINCPIVHRFL